MRVKSQFLASLSHELRTPVRGILSYARFGLREWGVVEGPVLRDYFQSIHDGGSNLLDLLNNLLELAGLESGRMRFELGPLDVGEAIDAVLTEFQPLATEQDVALGRASATPPPAAWADRTRVLQVLRNLLSNAVHHTPAGRAVRVETEADEHRVRIEVHNDGEPIPVEMLETIFDLTHFAPPRAEWGGTGLSLAICREIAQAHAGRIWAENDPEGGVRVIFEVPRADRFVVAPAEDPPADGRAAA